MAQANRLIDNLEQVFYNSCAARKFVGDPRRVFISTFKIEYYEEGIERVVEPSFRKKDIMPAGHLFLIVLTIRFNVSPRPGCDGK